MATKIKQSGIIERQIGLKAHIYLFVLKSSAIFALPKNKGA